MASFFIKELLSYLLGQGKCTGEISPTHKFKCPKPNHLNVFQIFLNLCLRGEKLVEDTYKMS
jgi:hypothetical protein